MTNDGVSQALAIELTNVIGDGWSVSGHEGSFIVVGPDSPDFKSEVWRIARFVAYDEHVCIEREGETPKGYRVFSRSRRGLSFEVRIRAVE